MYACVCVYRFWWFALCADNPMFDDGNQPHHTLNIALAPGTKNKKMQGNNLNIKALIKSTLGTPASSRQAAGIAAGALHDPLERWECRDYPPKRTSRTHITPALHAPGHLSMKFGFH